MITPKNYADKTANAFTDIRPLREFAGCVGEALKVVGATALSILTLGTKAEINVKANDMSSHKEILKKPYQYILRIVNPDRLNPCTKPQAGIFSELLFKPIFTLLEAKIKSKSFFTGQIISRSVALLAIPVIIIASIADNALGLIAAAFSLFPCFGRLEKINKFANDQLTFTYGFSLLALRAVVNPNPKQFI